MATSRTEKAGHLLSAVQATVVVGIMGLLAFGVFAFDSVGHMTEESVILSEIHHGSVSLSDSLHGWAVDQDVVPTSAPETAVEGNARNARPATGRRRDEPEVTADRLRDRSRERDRLRGGSDAAPTSREGRSGRDREGAHSTSKERPPRPERQPRRGRTAAIEADATVMLDDPFAGRATGKSVDAVPVAMNDGWIEIDASPRGKSKVPFSRIGAIGMAAVSGLGNRPVLIVDIVLTGPDGVDEPMKLIRFRSDRFDPLGFEPAATSPLAALTAWVQRLQNESNAICLPSESILAGKFARFETLEAYEREILMAVREDES